MEEIIIETIMELYPPELDIAEKLGSINKIIALYFCETDIKNSNIKQVKFIYFFNIIKTYARNISKNRA